MKHQSYQTAIKLEGAGKYIHLVKYMQILENK